MLDMRSRKALLGLRIHMTIPYNKKPTLYSLNKNCILYPFQHTRILIQRYPQENCNEYEYIFWEYRKETKYCSCSNNMLNVKGVSLFE